MKKITILFFSLSFLKLSAQDLNLIDVDHSTVKITSIGLNSNAMATGHGIVYAHQDTVSFIAVPMHLLKVDDVVDKIKISFGDKSMKSVYRKVVGYVGSEDWDLLVLVVERIDCADISSMDLVFDFKEWSKAAVISPFNVRGVKRKTGMVYMGEVMHPGKYKIEPGDSGSPVVDEHKKLIGLVSANSPDGRTVAIIPVRFIETAYVSLFNRVTFSDISDLPLMISP
ncbi:S1 family peptidase [Candidatus Parcubacteria bacterium]|nr:S1 family peptidase [Candidatus Parcubacteria bacterium]